MTPRPIWEWVIVAAVMVLSVASVVNTLLVIQNHPEAIPFF
jgi:hypothetical protein